jgi:hypothetical protein
MILTAAPPQAPWSLVLAFAAVIVLLILVAGAASRGRRKP